MSLTSEHEAGESVACLPLSPLSVLDTGLTPADGCWLIEPAGEGCAASCVHRRHSSLHQAAHPPAVTYGLSW